MHRYPDTTANQKKQIEKQNGNQNENPDDVMSPESEDTLVPWQIGRWNVTVSMIAFVYMPDWHPMQFWKLCHFAHGD